jgi:spore coat protein U-like protein
MRKVSIAIILCALIAMANSAYAVNCNIIGGPPALNFGTYDKSSGTPTDVNTTMRIRCTGDPTPSNVVVALDRGLNFQPPSDRRMSFGGSFLTYNLFKDASRTDIWGDNTFGSTPVTLLKDQRNQTFNLTIYGRIPALQNLPFGIYNDTVTITLTFSGAQSPKTETLAISGEIVGSCSFVTSGSIDFGSLDPVAAPPVVGAVAQPQVQCSSGLPYVITDDTGLNEAVPDAPPLRLRDAVTGTNFIPYSIAYTANKTGTGLTDPMDINATIAGGAYAGSPPDTYTDTITFTVTW